MLTSDRVVILLRGRILRTRKCAREPFSVPQRIATPDHFRLAPLPVGALLLVPDFTDASLGRADLAPGCFDATLLASAFFSTTRLVTDFLVAACLLAVGLAVACLVTLLLEADFLGAACLAVVFFCTACFGVVFFWVACLGADFFDAEDLAVDWGVPARFAPVLLAIAPGSAFPGGDFDVGLRCGAGFLALPFPARLATILVVPEAFFLVDFPPDLRTRRGRGTGTRPGNGSGISSGFTFWGPTVTRCSSEPV